MDVTTSRLALKMPLSVTVTATSSVSVSVPPEPVLPRSLVTIRTLPSPEPCGRVEERTCERGVDGGDGAAEGHRGVGRAVTHREAQAAVAPETLTVPLVPTSWTWTEATAASKSAMEMTLPAPPPRTVACRRGRWSASRAWC